MAITQHVKPRTNVLDGPGWCLRHTQSVYGLTGAPFWHESAWKAWLATEHKHKSRTMPNASVPVWLSHFGTYGAPARYDNWGHVVAYVPGRGFLSSPAWVRPGQTVGQQWFDSIEAVERTFNAKFVGWSEDLNGTRIISGAGGSGSGSTGEDVMTKEQYDGIIKFIGAQHSVTRGSSNISWLKRRIGGGYSGESLTSKINRALGGIEGLEDGKSVDVQELAGLVADAVGPRIAEVDAAELAQAVSAEFGKRLSEQE